MIVIIIYDQTKFDFAIDWEESFLPDDDTSGGKRILAGGDMLADSESVSMHERIAATVALGVIFKLGDFGDSVCVSRDGVRRRKLTRFRNDWLLRSFDMLRKNNDPVWCIKRREEEKLTLNDDDSHVTIETYLYFLVRVWHELSKLLLIEIFHQQRKHARDFVLTTLLEFSVFCNVSVVVVVELSTQNLNLKCPR